MSGMCVCRACVDALTAPQVTSMKSGSRDASRSIRMYLSRSDCTYVNEYTRGPWSALSGDTPPPPLPACKCM